MDSISFLNGLALNDDLMKTDKISEKCSTIKLFGSTEMNYLKIFDVDVEICARRIIHFKAKVERQTDRERETARVGARVLEMEMENGSIFFKNFM